MDFNFRGFDSPRQHNPLFLTSSSSSFSRHTFFSDDPITGVWPMGIRVGRVVATREAIEREMVKERLRSEILAEEIARQRLRIEMMERDTVEIHNNRGFTSSYMLGPPVPSFSSYHNQYETEINLNVGLMAREDIRRVMSSREIHGGSDGSYGRDIGGFELVSFQRGRPHPPEIKEITTYQTKDVTKEVVHLGHPFGAPVFGLKRKLPPSPASERSSKLCSDASNKRLMEEWSCAVSQISATSEQGSNYHLAGKRHQSKMAALNGSKKCGEIGLGKIKNSVSKQPVEIKNSAKCVSFTSKEYQKTERENTKPKLKPWCKVCQVETSDEKNMIQHKEGKQHFKNILKRARANNRRYRNKRF